MDRLISEQKVLKTIDNLKANFTCYDFVTLDEVASHVKAIPSAEPKTGHWEWVQYDYNPKIGNWHCTECRCVVVECVDKNEKGGIPLYKYCPQCGAKMIEPQERSE